MDRSNQHIIVAAHQRQLLRDAAQHRLAARVHAPAQRPTRRFRLPLSLRPQLAS